MATPQQFFGVQAAMGRIASSLGTAAGLEQAFNEKVQQMLDGSGPPVTPQEVEQYSTLIAAADNDRAAQMHALKEKVDEMLMILTEHFGGA